MNFFKATVLTLSLAALTISASAAEILDINAVFGNGIGGSGNTPKTFDYKLDITENSESGELAPWLTTVISNDGLTATVTWAEGTDIDIDFLYLKASNEYVYWDLSSVDWSAYTGFQVTNNAIFNQRGRAHAISHIQTSSVPDQAGTWLLMMAGLGALAMYRRR